MITLKYRLIGSVDNPEFTKTFINNTACNDWLVDQPVLVLSKRLNGIEIYVRK